MDGELGVGSPTDPDFYRNTVSAVMREDGEPDFRFYVFDRVDLFEEKARPYVRRVIDLADISLRAELGEQFVPHRWQLLHSRDDLDRYEERALTEGYEGVMIRDPDGPYKQGRSTAKEGYLLKVKRFNDAEGRIVGFEEKMHNGNAAFTSEIGRTKRSSHQENMVPTGTLGALILEGVTAFEGLRFNVGTGMDDALRADIWSRRDDLMGSLVKFKYFAIGGKDLPRFPVFLGFRDSTDMGE
jgi:DNA ligase-1